MNSMVMNRDIITNWEPRHERLFGRELIQLQHTLRETGMFTREAVAKLVENCPQEHFGLESMCVETDRPDRIYGIRGDASGKDTIKAIEKGRMWMNLRRVMDWSPEHRKLLDEIFDEFEGRMPGFKTFKRNMHILVSSPNAKVFYHADIQGQSLWQIEGVKSVYLYPRSEAFMSPQSVEKILLRETDEDLEYQNWFDEYATKVDLKPGNMITWPLYAPHRVQNHDCLNISVAMEHWTKAIWNSYAVHYGNGVLRRTIGMGAQSTNDYGMHVYPKAAAAFAWKKFGGQIDGDVVKERQFRIDASSPEGRVDL